MVTTPARPAPRLSARRAVLALLAAGAITAGAAQLGSIPGAEPPTHTDRVGITAVTDFSDDRRLVGFAEDVFFGRVTGEGSTIDKQPVPETDFPVQVLGTLKGSAAGSLIVVQEGGDPPGKDDELVLVEGDQELLPGQTYLFATRSDPLGRHFLVPKYGDLRVRSAAHQNELRARFTEAVRAQIPLD